MKTFDIVNRTVLFVLGSSHKLCSMAIRHWKVGQCIYKHTLSIHVKFWQTVIYLLILSITW